MQNPILVHKKNNSTSTSSEILDQFPLWQTCLRKIYFMPLDISEQELRRCSFADDLMDDEEGMNFLIQVLCGLHSPLLGENEVFGQFKQFVESRRERKDIAFSDQQKWLQFTYQEVKRLRTKYISSLGSKSYGSLIRKLVQSAEFVSLLGTGQLAEEIMPWLSHKNNLQIVGRNSTRLQFFETKYAHLQVKKLSDTYFFNEELIVAAPLTNDHLFDLLKVHGKNITKIYDLRGLSSKDEENGFLDLIRKSSKLFQPQIEVIFLNHLFELIQTQRLESQKIVDQMKNEIAESTQKYLLRLEHRPLGWDDLCA